MKAPSSAVEQLMPGGEEDGQDRARRTKAGGRGRGATGEAEQRDLGGGVEAEAEQQPDRVHVRRDGCTDLRDAGEEPVEQAAVVQLVLEFGLVVVAGAHLAERPAGCR